MSDEDALLSAIAAHPNEDTPRLMYADWLDEHGRAIRAELIRVQIEVARKEERSFEVTRSEAPLFLRNDELLLNHRQEFLGPLAALERAADIRFRRGFVDHVSMHVDAFLAHANLLAELRPWPGVRVTGVAADLGGFLRCPRLDIVTGIVGYPLSGAPHQGVPDEVTIAAGVSRLSRLAVLELDRCGTGDGFCAALVHFGLPALERLSLAGNMITDTGVMRLLASAHPKKLRRVILGANQITDMGAVALAEDWPRGADDRLEYLDLRDTHIGPDGTDALRARFGNRAEVSAGVW